MHLAEDLGLLVLGRVLEQIGDLGWLEPPDPGQRAAQPGAAGVPDQRLEPGPVAEARARRARCRPGGADPAGRPAAGARPPPPAPTRPSGCSRSSRSAARTRCAVGTSISRCPSTSARSSTSPSRRSKRRRSSWALVSFSSLPSNRPVCSTGTNTSRPPDLGHQPGDHRQAVPAQPDDDVLHPAQRLPVAVRDRAFEQVHEVDGAAALGGGRGIRLCRGHSGQCYTPHRVSHLRAGERKAAGK